MDRMDLQQRLINFASLGAGWVMWLLVILSVIALAIAFERAMFFFKTKGDTLSLLAAIQKHLGEKDVDGAVKTLNASPSFEAKIALAALERVEDGAAASEQRIAREAVLSKLAMEKNLAFLGTVGNNAPFVGLLGTVIGIMRSFKELDTSGGQVSAGLMSEIGEALVATAIGLVVALPAVAFFNLFQRVIKGRVGRGEALSKEVLAFLKATELKAAELKGKEAIAQSSRKGN